MTFSGDTAYFQPSFSQPGVPTPAVTQTFQGGFATLQNSLEIRVDFTANTQQVTLTIDFAAIYSAGVNNVSFTLFDIDSQTTYKDQIRSIWATDITGAQIAPIISGVGTAATVTGAGLNQTIDGIANSSDTGAGSDAGNATISFGSTPIRSLTFTYGNVTGTQADPTTQKIGLYNLSYSPVPEMNPAWLGAGTVLIGIGYKLRRGGRTTAPVT